MAKGPAEAERDALYAVGAWLAGNLAGVKIEERDLGSIEEGLADALLGRPLRVEPQEVAEGVQKLISARRAELAADEKRAAAPFLAEARARPAAERTVSGVIFESLAEGEGESPGLTDQVRVHYEGTLRDGTRFDGTEKGAVVFGMTNVSPCWTEALQRMQPGGKARITCPSDLAYGDRGIPGRILPGAPLRFEIELLEVLPASADSGPAQAGPRAKQP
jgi:FKBP-type peptidyl-prolyl cis-trans isomerase